MENHPVKVTVTRSACPHYQAGDEIFFDGALVDKEKSAKLCMVALNAIYPFVYAARRGGWVKDTAIQCPDCAEAVEFMVSRLD